jgi:hypothetical protein
VSTSGVKDGDPRKLTIVIGAGASYDCADGKTGAEINDQYRPPLAKDIFGTKFNKILSRYPAVTARLDELHGHAHRFRDTFSVELLLAGVPIERVSILLGHQSVRITGKHYAPWVRARQEQLEADVRRTWHTHGPQQGVHGGYTEKDARVIPFKSRRKNGGGGGSRTPVRKALRTEAYMLSSIPLVSPATLRMSKKRSQLVRWFSPEPYGPKGSGQLTV